MNTWAKYAAHLIVLVAATGVTCYYGDFVKVRVGPLFLLEFLFLLWVPLAIASGGPHTPSLIRPLRAAALFFLWGSLIAVVDILFRRHALADGRAALRMAQHMILFTYPLMWLGVGAWCARSDWRLARLLALAVLAANVIPNLLGHNIANYSIGPLIAIPLMLATAKAGRKPRDWAVVLLLGLVAFTPFWRMWLAGEMQRTSFLLLVFLMTTTALLLRRPLKLGIPLALLLAGFLAGSFASGDPVSKSFFAAMQKNEDIPYAGNPAPFQARARRFWWKTALSDWTANPVIGIGFIPELPSFLEENMPNNWESVQNNPRLRSSAPVSGPHNSYLSVLARMGLVGLLIFGGLAFDCIRRAWRLVRNREPDLTSLLIVLVPMAGALHALLNVGFEAPHNCMVMWLFAGMLLAYPLEYPINHFTNASTPASSPVFGS